MKSLLLVALAVSVSHCGKSTPSRVSGALASASSSADARAAATGDAGEPMDPREADAWARAKDGEDDDRMRLADQVGCQGLRERAQEPVLRPTALRSMAFCPDFSELPWLTNIAAAGSEEEAALALDAILEQAARRRRATDPEDADELGVGCRALLALSRSADRPKARRAKAIGALRMLADRGCVRRADVPSDLDAK